MKRHRPKKITPQQITGQQGVNFVERVVLEMKFTWHPTNAGLEAGIDGFIEIIDPATGEATNNILQVQVKTTTKKWTYETTDTFTYRCEPRDVDYWLSGNTPVILVVVRPEGNEAYWANMQEVFADPKRRKDPHVSFDKKKQRFDASATGSLMRIAVSKDVGPYLPATQRPEELVSNLLKLATYPQMIYVAATDYRDPIDLVTWAKTEEVELSKGWCLTDKAIHCFHDLREEPWRQICDVGTVEAFESREWAASNDPDRQREFVRLLNQAFRGDMRLRRLWRSKDERCYFFPPRFDRDGNIQIQPRRYAYQSLQQWTSSEIVMIHRYPATDEVMYWRHDAFKHAFLRINDDWHIAITPHYVFTTDGRVPHPYGESLLSGIKRLERQMAVLGQVVMWKYNLTYTRPKDLFDREGEDERPLIVFDDLLRATCDRGINDADWLPGESADEVIDEREDGVEEDSSDGELFE